MKVWIGIDVDDQLSELKNRAKEIESELGFLVPACSLPYHISLKMSFDANEDNIDAIIRDIENIYDRVEPFEIDIDKIEYESVIVWVMMCQNDDLSKLHDELNTILLEKYGVALHEYDTDYKFHVTLFMDGDPEKTLKAYDKIKAFPLPKKLSARKFAIGLSPNGDFGTYRMIKEIIK